MMGDWTFFSNHGHVFFCLARNGDARLRDVAADVGITERAVQKIVRDLEQAGYIEVRKQGRCNRYRINRRKSLRHPLQSHCSVSRLVNLVVPGAPRAALEAEPEPVPEAEPKTIAAPTPVAEPVAEPKPPAEPEPLPEPEPVPEPPAHEAAESDEAAAPKAAPESVAEPGEDKPGKRGKKARSEPIDVRKQGSLF